MKHTLEMAPGLEIPLSVATKRLAFLGTTGSGKSYGAMKLAELMLAAGIQVVMLDNVGVWYGLRIAANGKDPGIQIPVFGGLHGDVPIEPTAGALIADLITDRKISAVIDISQMDSDTDALKFARDFGKRIFERHKQKSAPIMIFLEECQEFIPEQPGSQFEIQCLHAWKRVIKIGRNFGLGIGMLSQRPQEVSKKCLNLSDCLFAFQMIGSQEREAMKKWIAAVRGAEKMLDILPELEVGQPHVYSPRWLKVNEVFSIAKRWTFDASSTPEVGATKQAVVKPLSADDLKALTAKMSETIERAKADDPKELKRKIAELQKQASKPQAAATAAAPAGPERLKKEFERGARSVKAELGKQLRGFLKACNLRVSEAADALAEAQRRLAVGLDSLAGTGIPPFPSLDEIIAEASKVSLPPAPLARAAVATPRVPLPPRAPRAEQNGNVSEGLTPVAQRIIDHIAELNALGIEKPDRLQVAVLSGYSNVKSSGYEKAIGALRTRVLIDYPDSSSVILTSEGLTFANQPGSPLSSQDLQGRLMRLVQPKASEILTVLIEKYPDAINRQELAEAVGYTNLKSSGFEKAIGRLRTMGLLDYPSTSTAVASSLLFLD